MKFTSADRMFLREEKKHQYCKITREISFCKHRVEEEKNACLHSDGEINKSQNSTTYAFFMIWIDDVMIIIMNFDVFRRCISF